jgi:hypothetical protein
MKPLHQRIRNAVGQTPGHVALIGAATTEGRMCAFSQRFGSDCGPRHGPPRVVAIWSRTARNARSRCRSTGESVIDGGGFQRPTATPHARMRVHFTEGNPPEAVREFERYRVLPRAELDIQLTVIVELLSSLEAQEEMRAPKPVRASARSSMDDDHHGLLIIRAWVEPGSWAPSRPCRGPVNVNRGRLAAPGGSPRAFDT